MTYTVQEVANLSGTTVKTLYHYQKVGLLFPHMIGENGYRYYTDKELIRLQQILFYRELDFSLEQIKMALENEPNQLKCLKKQKSLLSTRKERLSAILNTLDEAISHAQKGVPMNTEKMFTGLNKAEWGDALKDQNEHLQKEYGFSLDTAAISADTMNENAQEAIQFMSFMAKSLKENVSVNDRTVITAIHKHIEFLNINAKGFAKQSHFFLTDNFHRSMLEQQQVGLSYYLYIAADKYAESNNN
ncbi:MerR family transcriptional regulator [Clostridium fermenticellae]|uniref:MerR family transcriptional regulator n=1 Tax=Clostridium fermenticellae TaxID=2068654 RepID=A0A386H6E6_9CLOT|nr:MerR family transcriptional regulator [Clostridium fermenticellae]AYD41148.1 MerR family transcriptional regulator [Clostridium fermenticellae]